MRKILTILPISIAGTLILNGFSKGFAQNECDVLTFDVRELIKLDVKKKIRDFAPDVIFCYDYGYLTLSEVLEFVNTLKVLKVHYFADEPSSKYADFKEEGLHSKLLGDEKIFCWDKVFLDNFSPKATYFPLCVDESLYCSGSKNASIKHKYDISFVGRPLGEYRQDILVNIVKNFPDKLKIFSYPTHFERSVDEMSKKLSLSELEAYKKSFCGFVQEEAKLAEIYSSSFINLNMNLQGVESLNYRTFEVMASGGFLLSDRVLGFEEYLQKYDGPQDVVIKISDLLNNPQLAQNKAIGSRAMILEKYSLKIRAKELLSQIFGTIDI